MMGDTEDTVPAGQQDTFQASSSYVMVRVAFSWCSQGPLVKLQSFLTEMKYTHLVTKYLHLCIFAVSWWL